MLQRYNFFCTYTNFEWKKLFRCSCNRGVLYVCSNLTILNKAKNSTLNYNVISLHNCSKH